MNKIDFFIITTSNIFSASLPDFIFFKLFNNLKNFNINISSNFIYYYDDIFQMKLSNKIKMFMKKEKYTYTDHNYKALSETIKYFKTKCIPNELFSVFIFNPEDGIKNIDNDQIYLCQNFVKSINYNWSRDTFLKNDGIIYQTFKANKNIHNLYTSHEIKDSIGHKNKNLRTCRFCGRIGKNNFKNKSHTIPEAIGNKSIISLEECDHCNKKFGETIERDFINYFDLIRISNKQKSKNKSIPKLKGKDYEIFSQTIDNKELIFFIDKSKGEIGNDRKFEHPQKINLSNIYRTLCKISLGSIPEEYLNYFKKTIEWINGAEVNKDFIPNIKFFYNSPIYAKHPILFHYIKKNPLKKDIPTIISVLSFFNITIIFITPTLNEKVDSNFFRSDFFNNLFPMFSGTNSDLLDFSHDYKVKLTYNFDFSKIKKYSSSIS